MAPAVHLLNNSRKVSATNPPAPYPGNLFAHIGYHIPPIVGEWLANKHNLWENILSAGKGAEAERRQPNLGGVKWPDFANRRSSSREAGTSGR